MGSVSLLLLKPILIGCQEQVLKICMFQGPQANQPSQNSETTTAACPSPTADSEARLVLETWARKWPSLSQTGYSRGCTPLCGIADQAYTSPKQVQEQNMGHHPLQRLLQRIKDESVEYWPSNPMVRSQCHNVFKSRTKACDLQSMLFLSTRMHCWCKVIILGR